MCLNDDGNLFDAACTAVCAALWSLDLPVVELGESNEIRMTDGKSRLQPAAIIGSFSCSGL